ncbi:N-methylhydantoinase A/oxoprolinase/acetone carboxylase, beta subunit [Desulfotomaculum arcticum]|uniref:N-methylhydantoinase A/oxoprolinase/acetone carboxylase, beta subunit n=1 Tax=Desulfotruncus arcticus DSM 17038 TaxID=1121424 RepID=A0A1I2S961_9FIRM|nr:hydantoinase/oxoprolinase family protein [Desulfotruncus arcticus]SFG46586.1 N-methylhydantoinase A/oxoprolinase/acetone carboxylase, beta subunit [Desulfotomaculum arcticum] [Desulfotruncus arcticus DSM 17038]
MYIGIDVGGTCTDAVLLDNGLVRATAKVPTGSNDILTSLLSALDQILKGVPAELIDRVVFSTTLITNLIVERKYDPVGLILIPGPGLSHVHYQYKTDTHIISGAIDYRGREIMPLRFDEIENAVVDLLNKDYKKVAVVGKFSVRNNKHEVEVVEVLKKYCPECHIEMGHQVAGQLSFPRRVISTMLTCATRDKYSYFVDSVKEAMVRRGITGSVFILKADGGTMPLGKETGIPIETIFSGPAASTLGVQALIPPGETSVVVDIGGTTTDLALILSGQPLLAAKGAPVYDQLTQVRALAVKSVPVGGDSIVERVGKEIVVYSERLGAPYCLGGPMPTPTDALRVLGLTSVGNEDKARDVMESLGKPLGMSCYDVANHITNLVIDIIIKEIDAMFLQWEQEPAYRVWEVLQKRKERPRIVVGVGGGAAGFITKIAAKIGCYPVIPPYAPVANAIGAAVALPTLQVSLRADTEQGYYTIEEEGFQGQIAQKRFTEEDALTLANDWIKKRAEKYELKKNIEKTEVTRRDVFTMVRNWVTTGRIYDICVQTPRGIMGHIGSRGEF